MTKRTHLAMDRALVGFAVPASLNDRMAFDRASVRTNNEDGHLHVAKTNISKAAINPYRGSEIPNHEALGLEPNKLYRLYRHPEELEKAVHTFNRLPVLSEHSPINADSHDHRLVVGSTGDGATYEHPFLTNSLAVWTRGAIDGIEDGSQKELSSAYRYRADMTPGEVDGEKYDGVMRDIRGSHVAIVKKGRAGPDVVVGDEAIKSTLKETFPMSKKIAYSARALLAIGALMATTKPMLAMDAKLDVATPFKGVTNKNFAEKQAGILAAFRKSLMGKLAQDTDLEEAIEGVKTIMEAIGEPEVANVVEEMTDDDNAPAGGSADAGLPPEAMEYLSGLLDEAQMAKLMEIVGSPPEDESPEAKAAREKKEADDKKAADDKGKQAMDAAIEAAVTSAVKTAENRIRQEAKDLAEARELVRPYVGSVPMALDSAEQVFRHTLAALNVEDAKTMPGTALKAVLKAQPVPGTERRRSAPMAQDSAGEAKSFFETFPGAEKIGV